MHLHHSRESLGVSLAVSDFRPLHLNASAITHTQHTLTGSGPRPISPRKASYSLHAEAVR